ncbi:MAG: peptide deformylase [Candidatus Roizmanbacteria bacterium]|nr:peptide deformylase [Candidatus Roizmanbacteria bacterium]
MKREIIQIGHPALKAKNKPLKEFRSKKVKQLIQDLKDTLQENELIGIAAPQLGENFQIFVTEARNTQFRTLDKEDIFRVYINPRIIWASYRYATIYEGCGSVLNGKLFGPVIRPSEVTIVAENEKGRRFQLKCDGILSRVIQHEYDHLHGIEFLEKVSNYSQLLTDTYYVQNIKTSKEQVNNSKITIIEHKSL